MRYLNILFLVAFSFLIVGCSNTNPILDAKKSVVAVLVNKTETPLSPDPTSGLGAGFIIKENTIITAYHVVGNAKTIVVMAEHGTSAYEADLVYGDEMADVAVIRLRDWEKFKSRTDFTYVPIGTMDDIQTLNDVYVIGHPWSMLWAISKGIISKDYSRLDNLPHWYIQTDAHLFQGNSGGPVIVESGKVIGMSDIMISRDGGSFGFAVPMPLVLKVIRDLEKYKEVRWAIIGIKMANDATIKDIVSDSPAQKIGLKIGDRIVGVSTPQFSESIDNSEDFVRWMSVTDYAEPIELKLVRNGLTFKMQFMPDFYNSSQIQLLTP